MGVIPDSDHGAPVAFQRLGLIAKRRCLLRALLKIAVLAQPEAASVKLSCDALARENLHVPRGRRSYIA